MKKILFPLTVQQNLTLQYSIVGLILLFAFGWIIYKLMKVSKRKTGPCCGCGMSDCCEKKPIKKHDNGDHICQ